MTGCAARRLANDLLAASLFCFALPTLTPSLISKPPLKLGDFDLDERDQSGKSNDEYAEFPNHGKRGVQKFIHKHSQRKKEIMRL